MTRKRSQLEKDQARGDLTRRALRQRQGLQAFAFCALVIALVSTLFPWRVLRYGSLIEEASDGAQTLQGQVFLLLGMVAIAAIGLQFLRDGARDRLLLVLCLSPVLAVIWFLVEWSSGASFEPLLRSEAFEKVVSAGRQRSPEELVAVLGLGFWGSSVGAINAAAAALFLVIVPWSESEDT